MRVIVLTMFSVKLTPLFGLDIEIADACEEVSKALKRKAVELSGHEPAKQFRNEIKRFLGKQETETWLNEELGAETMLI